MLFLSSGAPNPLTPSTASFVKWLTLTWWGLMRHVNVSLPKATHQTSLMSAWMNMNGWMCGKLTNHEPGSLLCDTNSTSLFFFFFFYHHTCIMRLVYLALWGPLYSEGGKEGGRSSPLVWKALWDYVCLCERGRDAFWCSRRTPHYIDQTHHHAILIIYHSRVNHLGNHHCPIRCYTLCS